MDGLRPQTGESQGEFAVRFHETMRDGISDTDERNSRAMDAWRKYAAAADPVEQRAQRRFGPEEFKRVNDVPVFGEHQTKDDEDNPVVYDRAALQSIIQRCNARIADTGDFAPLTDGHTPDKEQLAKGARMPEILGYSGPFRLGMIGNKNPRWAIFSDEYHHLGDADKLKKLPRRSPEVWLEPKMSDG